MVQSCIYQIKERDWCLESNQIPLTGRPSLRLLLTLHTESMQNLLSQKTAQEFRFLEAARSHFPEEESMQERSEITAHQMMTSRYRLISASIPTTCWLPTKSCKRTPDSIIHLIFLSNFWHFKLSRLRKSLMVWRSIVVALKKGKRDVIQSLYGMRHAL